MEMLITGILFCIFVIFPVTYLTLERNDDDQKNGGIKMKNRQFKYKVGMKGKMFYHEINITPLPFLIPDSKIVGNVKIIKRIKGTPTIQNQYVVEILKITKKEGFGRLKKVGKTMTLTEEEMDLYCDLK